MIKLSVLFIIMLVGVSMRYRWIEGSIKPLHILSTSPEGQALMHYGYPKFLIVPMKSGQHAVYAKRVTEGTNVRGVHWTSYSFNNYTADPYAFMPNSVLYSNLKSKDFKASPVEDSEALCPMQMQLKFNMMDELMTHWRNIGKVD